MKKLFTFAAVLALASPGLAGMRGRGSSAGDATLAPRTVTGSDLSPMGASAAPSQSRRLGAGGMVALLTGDDTVAQGSMPKGLTMLLYVEETPAHLVGAKGPSVMKLKVGEGTSDVAPLTPQSNVVAADGGAE